MKKWISSLLIGLLLCALIVPLTVSGATAAQVVLESVEATADESVQLRLSLVGNPGLVAMFVTVHFDTSDLALTDVKNGDVFPDSTVTFGNDLTQDHYTLTWLDATTRENYTADGTLATLTFHVLPGAKAGKSVISVETDPSSIFDYSLHTKTVVPSNGSVTISKPVVPVKDVSVQSSLSLRVGETAVLTATVTPADATDPSVSWTTSDASVASVNNGTVTARAVGTADITVTTNDGGKTARCTVTVQPKIISVTNVMLSSNSLTMTQGETARLTATVLPSGATNTAVTWTASAPAVASVDANGNVTAKAPGTSTITVRTADSGKTASCTVTVKVATVAVSGISMPSSLTVTYKSSARLTATVEPSNATNSAVQWSSSDPNVVEVDANGNLTTHRKGTATITATTIDGGKQARCSVTVQYTFIQKIIIYLLFGWIWYVK